MHLRSIDDHRSFLEKATRKELERFAKARGVKDVVCGMPAQLMRDLLRMNGVTDIENFYPYLRTRQLGAQRGVNNRNGAMPDENVQVKTIDAAADLARQWKEQQKAAPEPEPDKPKRHNAMAALRSECKRRGITISRRDKKQDLEAKLNVENAPSIR